MKFQMKLLSLAVIGLALAAPVAHAAIDAGSGSPGNGELFFSLWSDNGTATTADDVSYTRDLGLRLNDFAGAASPFALTATATTASLSPIFNFTANTLLSNFLNSANLAGANLLWNVAASDSLGADRLLTTAAQGTTALPSQATTAFRNVSAAFTAHLAAVNTLSNTQNATPSSSTAVNNSNTATTADGAAYAGGVAWGTNFGNRVAFNNTGTIGAQLPFFLRYETSTTQTGNAFDKQFADSLDPANKAYWTLDAQGNLSYNIAAVPEADTWAMFAAGLLAVGAIARRRLAA